MKKRTFAQPLSFGISLAIALTLLSMIASTLYLQRNSTFAHAEHTGQTTHNLAFRLARPHYWMAGPAAAGKRLPCQTQNAANRCYTPQQIQKAYNIAPLLAAHTTGLGHTIVIVDAFQSPTLRHDLALFDALFGLKAAKLNIIAPDGLAPFNPKDAAQVSWAAEITLDVEWAHAIAPSATIDLVLANPTKDPNANTLSGFLLNILHATSFAVTHNLGDVISQSFGGNETCASKQALQAQHKVFQAAIAKGITMLAASGDLGAAEINCTSTAFTKSVSTPASDPLVTAVGGTTLNANATTGAYMTEVAWNGSGGGLSAVYPRPTFQQGIQTIIGNQRGVPDIAYDGDPKSGMLVVWSSSGRGKDLAVVFGGTSAGSPQWAGITVLMNEVLGKRVGFLNPVLYRIGSNGATESLHDITQGTNTFTGKNANRVTVTIKGFTATEGWDAVTGWGTPNVANLVMLVARMAK